MKPEKIIFPKETKISIKSTTSDEFISLDEVGSISKEDYKGIKLSDMNLTASFKLEKGLNFNKLINRLNKIYYGRFWRIKKFFIRIKIFIRGIKCRK